MRITNRVEQAIRKLETGRGGVTPEKVVEAARDEDSPLHDFFTWDDTEAAQRWRIEQARCLLKRVKIEVVYQEKTVRTVAYVRDPKQRSDAAGYTRTMNVRKEDATSMMMAELTQIAALIARAHKLAMARAQELPDGVAEEVESVGKAIKQLKRLLVTRGNHKEKAA